MYKVMIVEDDSGIAAAVKKSAEQWGFEAFCAENFRDIMSDFAKINPQIVLLDITLPFFDGYHWCREIRGISNVPIIFISSAADSMNIIMAVNAGADDFISKPFDTNVLISKMQALLRRSYDFANIAVCFEHRGAFLNTDNNTITYNSQNIPLTKNEYRILLCLMKNKGKVVSREKLMESLWATDCFVDENTLNVNVNRLRKKLDAAGLDNFITTKFGVGYIVG